MTRRAVLFDVDGTLVDTTYVHTLCWWQAFREVEVDLPMAAIHRAIGMGADTLVEHLLPGGTPASTEQLAASHDALYAAYWPRLRVLPGARELVIRCHAAGLVTVLASSAAERELQVLLDLLELDSAIDHTTHAGDAGASKPAPDIVAVALERAGVPVEQAVFVGDAVWDVQACGKLGLDCIGLESGGTSAAELGAAGALACYRDAADLLSHVAELLR